jgi:hypothetical protein
LGEEGVELRVGIGVGGGGDGCDEGSEEEGGAHVEWCLVVVDLMWLGVVRDEKWLRERCWVELRIGKGRLKTKDWSECQIDWKGYFQLSGELHFLFRFNTRVPRSFHGSPRPRPTYEASRGGASGSKVHRGSGWVLRRMGWPWWKYVSHLLL